MPREGHDNIVGILEKLGLIFLSTCPVRGTTAYTSYLFCEVDISIHVPREGHDLWAAGAYGPSGAFLSTCPVRGTTRGERCLDIFPRYISIHVPREGHDIMIR